VNSIDLASAAPPVTHGARAPLSGVTMPATAQVTEALRDANAALADPHLSAEQRARLTAARDRLAAVHAAPPPREPTPAERAAAEPTLAHRFAAAVAADKYAKHATLDGVLGGLMKDGRMTREQAEHSLELVLARTGFGPHR
jgi:hypothetical protein